jgi:3-deoxy-D-manno-octulosonic-acid transferase
MFFSLLYEFILIILGLFALPKFFYQLLFLGKHRKSWLKRLGGGFPLIKKGKKPLIWIHAVSLGETKAAASLVKALKNEFNHPLIIFSTTTETGYVESCRSIQADHHVYLPFDFGWVIKPIIKRTAPDLVILCESDFWYNFLATSKKIGAVVVLVNGKISEKSMQRFQKAPFFTRKLFSNIDLFCLQSQLYRQRFEQLGILQDKLIVTGNMKFDGDYSRLPAAQLEAWKSELGIQAKDAVLVIGSSHHPEELMLLNVMHQLWPRFPNLKVMIVPRHPERFSEVAGLLQKNSVDFRRLSQKNLSRSPAPVILIDAMGLLRKCYQLADIAIVAGSYTAKVGGHNILEPSWYGVPVIFGPHMHTQPDLVNLVNEYRAGIQVSLEELPDKLCDLLQNPSQRKELGEAGLKLAGDLHGATVKTLKLIKKQALHAKKSVFKHCKG